MKNDKKNLKTKFEQAIESAAVNTNYQYWYESTCPSAVLILCRRWFGKELTAFETTQVFEMLKIYPAPDRDEAIETVLFIYFANQK